MSNLEETVRITVERGKEVCQVIIQTPGYEIYIGDAQGEIGEFIGHTPVTFNCASIPISDGIYECTKYITLFKPTKGVVHTCNDAKIVFRKVVGGDWYIDKEESSSCTDVFEYTATDSSITLTIEEEAPGSCVYPMADPAPRPAFQLEDAQLTYNDHVALPGSTAAIAAGVEVTAKAYIRNTKPTLDMAFKAMLMLTRVLAGNEYVYKRSSAYACYEDHGVYFDVKFLMPSEDTEVRLRAYHTNTRECYQDISNSFYLKVAEHEVEEPPLRVASITCTTVPSDAMVYLDGQDTGQQTPTSITTTAGEHYILYRKAPNYINYETKIITIADSTITVAADLEEGTTAKGYWTDIKDTVIPVEVAIENTCTHPWCLENMGKWIKVEVGLDYPFTHRSTHFCILLDLSAGNPLPEYIHCPFRSVRFETEGPSSYAIPKVIATESINKLLQTEGEDGAVLLSQSDIPRTLYQGTSGTFNLSVLNIGSVSTEYKVSVIFEGMDIVHEEAFESEWSEKIAPNETTTLPVVVKLSGQAIAAGQESAIYSIYTKLEATKQS